MMKNYYIGILFTRLFDAVTDEVEYEVYDTWKGVLSALSQRGEFSLITHGVMRVLTKMRAG